MTGTAKSKIHEQLDNYLSSLTECNALNLQRIDKDFLNMEKQYQKSVLQIINLPVEESVKWQKEETSEHYEDIAFLIKEFKRLNYIVFIYYVQWHGCSELSEAPPKEQEIAS